MKIGNALLLAPLIRSFGDIEGRRNHLAFVTWPYSSPCLVSEIITRIVFLVFFK